MFTEIDNIAEALAVYNYALSLGYSGIQITTLKETSVVIVVDVDEQALFIVPSSAEVPNNCYRRLTKEFFKEELRTYAAKETKIDSSSSAKETVPSLPSASDILSAGIEHMQNRATTYDKPAGERSMGKTVTAFNAIADKDLTEEQGWLFMGILKQVRSQQGNFKLDNYEDEAAYAGLRGEAAARERS